MIILNKAQIIRIMIALLFLCLDQISYAEPSKSQNPDDFFLKASREYEMGHYDDAIARYQLLLQQGIESGPLFYNLGNCFFKKGQLGKAILHYERAGKFIPLDSDLRANIQYATSLIRGASSRETMAWHEKTFERVSGGLSINGLIFFLSMLYTLSMVLLIAKIYLVEVRKYLFAAIAILMAFFFLGSLSLYGEVSTMGKEAIILIDQADVRYEPFERAPVHFTLYEGMKIRMLRVKGDWVKISASNQKAGWVQASTIEVI